MIANESFTLGDLISVDDLIRVARVRQHQTITFFNRVKGADVVAANEGTSSSFKEDDLLSFAGVASQGGYQKLTGFSVDVHWCVKPL